MSRWQRFKQWISWKWKKLRKGYGAHNELEAVVSGKVVILHAHHIQGRHLACSDESGEFPEGVLIEVADAVNRYRFIDVFSGMFDESMLPYWPDGTRLTINDLIG